MKAITSVPDTCLSSGWLVFQEQSLNKPLHFRLEVCGHAAIAAVETLVRKCKKRSPHKPNAETAEIVSAEGGIATFATQWPDVID
jgi:hypothetical protein